MSNCFDQLRPHCSIEASYIVDDPGITQARGRCGDMIYITIIDPTDDAIIK